MVEAADKSAGVALLSTKMFGRELQSSRPAKPFDIEIASGNYWLTSLKSKQMPSVMQAFPDWLRKATTA